MVDINDFLVTARSLDEYRAMFDLTDADLVGRTVLDCPGGASSFTAEASQLAAYAVAVDPVYEMSPGDLCVRALDDAALGARFLHENRERYDWTRFRSEEAHYAARVRAVGRFAWDRRQYPERYVSAALPELPFRDREFDFVLCSNLLFSYDDRIDIAAHLAAIRELLRVCSGEVRVFPLLGYAGERSAFVETIVTTLGNEGLDVQLQPVPYAFQRGSHEALRVSLTSAP